MERAVKIILPSLLISSVLLWNLSVFCISSDSICVYIDVHMCVYTHMCTCTYICTHTFRKSWERQKSRVEGFEHASTVLFFHYLAVKGVGCMHIEGHSLSVTSPSPFISPTTRRQKGSLIYCLIFQKNDYGTMVKLKKTQSFHKYDAINT